MSTAVPRPALSRHYTSLQQHADNLQNTSNASEDATTRTRQVNRRDGFTLGHRSAYDDRDDEPRQNRSPLPPANSDQGTPPSLEELLRRPTNDDADAAHNARVAAHNRVNSELFSTHSDTQFPTSGTIVRRGSRKSSIVCFAKGLVRHVPDSTTAPVPDVPVEPETPQEERRLGSAISAYSSKDGKDFRNASFVSHTIPEDYRAFGTQLRATRSAGGSSGASIIKTMSKASQVSSSLRERREAAFDLSLPLPESRLSAQDLQLSSIVPSRPRSPKTPWIRPAHEAFPKSRASQNNPAGLWKSTTSYPQPVSPDRATLPDYNAIESSQSASVERQFTKVRDRYHMTRSKRRRTRSSARTGASEDALASTPDGSWTPDDIKAPQEPPMRTNAELGRLYQTSRTARAGRWRWPRSTRSSEGTPQTPAEQSSGRRLSINPFKRSERIVEDDHQDKKVPQSPTTGRFWWIGKQPGSTPTQAKPVGTRADADPFAALDPIPGPQRVRTVSTIDSHTKVERQLAGFAFDHDVGMRGMKSRLSPQGKWDSDALLMSYKSPDLVVGNEIDEEGPEGPPITEYAPRGFTVDCNPGCETPGLVCPPTPSGYMEARRIPTPQPTPRSLSPETWFRVQKRVTPVATPLTPHALQEVEERRKFEWIVPEHLPNSPLCPLHAKYTGYSAGKCFWHGTKSKTVRIETQESGPSDEPGTVRKGKRGWEVGAYDVFRQDSEAIRKRRLASLSTQ